MTRYQLAKLIVLVGTFHSRKRLQKTVHLLQAAGAPWNVPFRLHHYGPYSQELAGLLDDLVQLEVLEERCTATSPWSNEYSYRLTETGSHALEQIESAHPNASADFEPLRERFHRLNGATLRQLELASTIVYYRTDRGKPWDEAIELTCEFKEENRNSQDILAADKLAHEFVG